MKQITQTLKSLFLAIFITTFVGSLSVPPSNAQTNAQTKTEAKAGTAASVKKGQKLAQELCASCHNIKKTGKSTEKLAPPFRTFASKWPLESLEEALAEGIVVGHSIMPEFELKTDDITAMLDFMGDLAKK